jgi:hypothetical protein
MPGPLLSKVVENSLAYRLPVRSNAIPVTAVRPSAYGVAVSDPGARR